MIAESLAERIYHRIHPLLEPYHSHLVRDFLRGNVAAHEKADRSLVTASDQWADDFWATSLSEAFPNYGILSEESQPNFGPEEWQWVIDPLDGTTNFTRGLPIWGISLALLHLGIPVWGLVSLPRLQEQFWAWSRQAWWNGKSLRLPSHPPTALHQQFCSLCSRSVRAIAPATLPTKVRILGMASYNLLTVGTGATIAAIEATPKIWDIAAPWLILRNAGALWRPLPDGNPDPFAAPPDVGQNMNLRSLPTLVVSHADLLPYFLPACQHL
ncbi:MAG: inositol monophosphatase [Oscillatoriales cyanobacterium SM2_2_1]|nr:inositol monophosphatase [Oscillatoriales cyanobacterium SM2_2_1]